MLRNLEGLSENVMKTNPRAKVKNRAAATNLDAQSNEG